MKNRIEKIFDFVNNKIMEVDLKTNNFDDLIKGKLGLVLYCLNFYKMQKNEFFLDKIVEILDDIFDKISNDKSFLGANMTLADGLPGLGIVLNELLKEEIIDESFQLQVDIITESAYEKGIVMISEGNFDYLYGPSGILFYLNEVHADEYCSLIVDKLHAYAISHDYVFYNSIGDFYTQGINFGFAHGALGLSAVLLKVYERGLNQEKIKDILLNLTGKLLEFKKDNVSRDKIIYQLEGFDYPSWFPYNIITKSDNKIVKPELYDSNLYHFTDRLAWCNSDLGYVLMLYKIGVAFGKEEYIQISNKIGSEIINRKQFEDTAIIASNMCTERGG